MSPRGMQKVLLFAMLVCLIGAPAIGWAETTILEPPQLQSDTPVSDGFATAAAVVGTIFYAPFKAVFLCPVGALASGATYAATGGAKQPATYLLDLGCTGRYAISPGMIQGRETFQAIDEYPR